MIRPSGPGVEVINCALGAAFTSPAGSAIPINDKARMNKITKKMARIFIGADYIRVSPHRPSPCPLPKGEEKPKQETCIIDIRESCNQPSISNSLISLLYFPYLFLISGRK